MGGLNRKSYTLFFYVCFIVFLGIRYFDGLFLTQITTNPIRSPRVDSNVWLAQALNIPDLVSYSGVSLLIDALIVFLPIFILYRVYHDQKAQKLTLSLTFIFGLYILIIYCFPTLSIRKYLGLILIPVAFAFTSNRRYSYYLELMRYFILFVFTSASLWKIVRGVAWDTTHMQLSLKAQHIDNFVNWPDHYITHLISLIIDNSTYCAILFIIAIMSQMAFSIGFFTKKYDRVLALLLIVFIICDYLVMRIEYWEFIVFFPLLWKKIDQISPSFR